MAGGGKGGPDNTPIDAELRRAGAFGRFQVFITAVVVVGILSLNLLTHGIGILELEPVEPGFICTDKETGETYECDSVEFCDNPDVTYEVDEAADKENLYNWYTSLNLVCLPKIQTSLIAISCMLGIWVGVIFVPRMGDLYGRKPVFLAALWGSIPCLGLIVAFKKVLVVDIAAFVAGPCIIARMSCGFLMLMEHMPTVHQAKVGAIIMVSEGCTQIFWVFYLTCISQNTYYFLYFAIAINLISAILCIWVPESPRYLYGINDLEGCAKALAAIAAGNGVEDYQPAKFEVEYEIMVDNVDGDGDDIMIENSERKTENRE